MFVVKSGSCDIRLLKVKRLPIVLPEGPEIKAKGGGAWRPPGVVREQTQKGVTVSEDDISVSMVTVSRGLTGRLKMLVLKR